MAFSDCPKCWDTPCTCGNEWRSMRIDKVIRIRNLLNQIIGERSNEINDRSWDGPGNR
jgi:hypothetical protein